jgi:glycosyltransferase involved in cell wall biosynthesis
MPNGQSAAGRSSDRVVGYVLKGFPRVSELFIASEIHRLERSGMRLELFVITAEHEAFTHAVVDRIRARRHHLPPTASVSGVSLRRWLTQHLPAFAPALKRTIRSRPRGFLRAAAAALAQAFRAREAFWSPPRKVYVKEFLQAVALADSLRDVSEVRHLHAHFCHGTTTVTWLAAMISGRSFSFTAHAKDVYSPALNPAQLLRRKLAAARFAVTCTEASRTFLRRQAGATPVHRVYHGLNADFAQLIDRGLEPDRAPSGVLRVLGVGRLVPKKGFDVFVDACAELVKRGIPIDAKIVGEPGDHSVEVIARIREHRLDHCVHLVGPMSQAALFDEYRAATAMCLPCRVSVDGDRDGIPNVLVEAMASALPVVTTATSGIPELVEDGVNGLLVPADDPVRTADALLRIHRDRVLARRISEAGRRFVAERFDGDRLIVELRTLFEEVA